MILTTQARIDVSAHDDNVLRYYAESFGHEYRCLLQQMAATGKSTNALKPMFRHLSSRMYNSIAADVKGNVKSAKTLALQHMEDIAQKHDAAVTEMQELAFQLEEIDKGVLKVSHQKYKGYLRRRAYLYRKIRRLAERRTKAEKNASRHVPKICVGGRKLFHAQYNLEENGFANHEEWLETWRAERDNQFFVVGSKDESNGNVNCQAFVNADGTFDLKIRMPRDWDLQFIWVRNVELKFMQVAFLTALGLGVAISYRFVRDERGWQVMISIDVSAAELVAYSTLNGAIGLDFNADHIAVTETDYHGNLVNFWRFDLPFEGKTAGQRKAILNEAIAAIAKLALATKKPIAIEKLDFKAKKRSMGQMTANQNRVLSSLAYAQYQQQVASACHRHGIRLLKVNPAYTSFIGKVKYARKCKISGHNAAAGVIARAAQGFAERYPSVARYAGSTVMWTLPVRKTDTNSRDQWVSSFKHYKASLKDKAFKSPVGTRAKKEDFGASQDSPMPAWKTVTRFLSNICK